jgi:hypothetical protein
MLKINKICTIIINLKKMITFVTPNDIQKRTNSN